jgi:hypothetical protein
MNNLSAIKKIAACAVLMSASSLFLSVSAAQTTPAAAPPAELQAELQDTRLSGAGKLKVWGFDVYNARLFVSKQFQPDNFARHDFALELTYLRDFDNIDIAQRSIKEMRRVATVSDAQAQTWLKAMTDVFPDVKRGDRLLGIHRADGTSKFILNGQPIGQVQDLAFTQAFFAIWLSPNTSQPKLRKYLLAHAQPDAASTEAKP